MINHELFIEPLQAYIDPRRPVKRAIITHAHADHARAGHERVLATSQTIELMKLRYGVNCAKQFQALEYGETLSWDGVKITLYPAGHILGSAQVLLEYRGERIVATGDYKTIQETTSQAFELVPCDTLITEATFALPVFQHPNAAQEIDKLLHSLQQSPERTHLVGAYSLGKTQRVIAQLREQGYAEPIFLHGAHRKLSEFYQKQGIELGELRPAHEAPEWQQAQAGKQAALVLAPPSALRDKWARRFGDSLLGYASGWMSVKQRAKQSLVELPLVISDHVDWNELTQVIPATGAQRVWITHGREDALTHWCQMQGIEAEALSLQGREEREGD